MAVARFVGREFGLAGSTNLESALMDAVVDAVSEATEKQYTAYLFEKVLSPRESRSLMIR
jgi:hypothetical protein